MVQPTTLARATSRSEDTLAATAAMAVTVLCWASAFVVIRWVVERYGPGELALGRLLVGSVALGAMLALRGQWVRPTRREWWLLVLCGLAWFTVYNVALNAAEQTLDPGTTAMLIGIGPILLALAAGTMLSEGYPPWLVVGAAVAFGGATLIALASSRAANADLIGVLLALLAAVTYAIGVLAQKPVLRRLPAVQVVWASCTIGALGCVFFTPGLLQQVATAPWQATAGLVYLGVVPTALAFSTWAYALARANAGKLGITTYLVPPVTIVIAWVFLSEVPKPLALVGGVLCLVGVALSRRRQAPRA